MFKRPVCRLPALYNIYTATRQVRAWYVFDAIAKAENIEAKDEEKGKKVIEFVLANAKK